MRIAVIPGDGIGPEVIKQGMRVLERVNSARKLGLEFVHFGWNADEYLRTGVSIPPGAMDDIRHNYAAIYLGAFGDPRIPDMKHAADIPFGLVFRFISAGISGRGSLRKGRSRPLRSTRKSIYC